MLDPTDLWQHELDLEAIAVSNGRIRTIDALDRALVTRQFAENDLIRRVAASYIDQTAGLISSYINDNPNPRGNKRIALDILARLDADILATLTLQVCLGYALLANERDRSKISSLANIIDRLAKSVDEQFFGECLRDKSPKLYRYVLDAVNLQKIKPWQVKNVLKREPNLDVEAELAKARPDLTALLKAALAEPLITAALGTGLVEIETKMITRGAKAKLSNHMVLTESGLDLFSKHLDLTLALAPPMHLPMVVPPKRWTGLFQGPYLNYSNNKLRPFVSTFDAGAKKLLDSALKDGSMQPVQDALDVLQNTGFVFNPLAVSIVRTALDHNWPIANLPRTDLKKYALPGDFQELPKLDQRKEIIKAKETRQLIQEMGVGLLGINRQLQTMETISGYDVFYLPHYCDFRGRVYPSPNCNHHGSDLLRGCFLFAEGYPLGSLGLDALQVHIANCAAGAYGKLDKLPFRDRIEWTRENRDLILAIAEGWRDQPQLWTGCDAPISFVAAATEYREALMMDQPGGYLSRVPVGLDGTCSGLQHYSALMRAEHEGALVNLVPGDVPADIYSVVADRLIENLEADGGHFARMWLEYGVSRSTVKRQVMTFPYSAKQFGFGDQINNDTMRPLLKSVLIGELDQHPFGDEAFEAALYMAAEIWEVIQEVMPYAASAMNWIASVGELAGKEGVPLRWTLPSGFPVLHRYQENTTKTVKLFLGTREQRKNVSANLAIRGSNKYRIGKMGNAAAPNAIHSLDACHLVLSINDCKSCRIDNLAVIHDSFATHAGLVARLGSVLRDAFVRMYDGYDILRDIGTRAEEQGIIIPPYPKRGNLDLEVVKSSPYFFM